MGLKLKVSFEQLLEKAKKLNSRKEKWHFHMLGKDCVFNEDKSSYAIFLENTSSGEIFSAHFPQQPLTEAAQLALLLYGKKFFDEEGAEGKKATERGKELFERIKKVHDLGEEWHHHHFPPECLFNQDKGKHAIVFEDKENGKLVRNLYDSFPSADLRMVEKLMYSVEDKSEGKEKEEACEGQREENRENEKVQAEEETKEESIETPSKEGGDTSGEETTEDTESGEGPAEEKKETGGEEDFGDREDDSEEEEEEGEKKGET